METSYYVINMPKNITTENIYGNSVFNLISDIVKRFH